MTADYLFLDFGNSQFATEKRSARLNLVQYKDRWKGTWVSRLPDPSAPMGKDKKPENIFATQSGCIYSSFGLAEIFFDLENLYQVAGYRLWFSRLVQLLDRPSQGPCHGDLPGLGRSRPADPPPLEDQAEPPPSFHPDAIARRAVVLQDRDGIVTLESELESIEGGEEEEAAGELGLIVERNRERLKAGGDARKTIGQNVATWTGTVEASSGGPMKRHVRQLRNTLPDHRLEKRPREQSSVGCARGVGTVAVHLPPPCIVHCDRLCAALDQLFHESGEEVAQNPLACGQQPVRVTPLRHGRAVHGGEWEGVPVDDAHLAHPLGQHSGRHQPSHAPADHDCAALVPHALVPPRVAVLGLRECAEAAPSHIGRSAYRRARKIGRSTDVVAPCPAQTLLQTNTQISRRTW